MQALEIQSLSKRYRIGHVPVARHATFRDATVQAARRAAWRLRHPFLRPHRPDEEEFWALRDVSFTVKHGERLGIIGRNGAGKSTLLKLISRITPPTTGRIVIRGRVASLLEVGTGFHPELTGRENIFLNGAILGMTHDEIKTRFDAIVAFAEIERFLDTPVKRYSSGMYVRLAFSVAAHLEPEILIVDEVLAVGDIQFQKKCLGKMEQVANEGRTVLFVSHNMPSLLSLTSRCLLLHQGQLIDDGPSSQVIATYQRSFSDKTIGQTDLRNAEHYGTGKARFVSVQLRTFRAGVNTAVPTTGDDFEFEIGLEAYHDFHFANAALTLYDEIGNRLVDANTITKGDTVSMRAGQRATVCFRLRNLLLKGGIYTAGLWLGITNQEDIDGVRYATSFRVEHRREDVMYAPPFPGWYVCDFSHTITLENSETVPGARS